MSLSVRPRPKLGQELRKSQSAVENLKYDDLQLDDPQFRKD